MDTIEPAKTAKAPATEVEKELIKGIFKGNEALLLSLRALFFGLSITDDEKTVIKGIFSDKRLLKIMHNRFLPELDRNTPIGTIGDRWLGVEQMVSGVPRDTIQQVIEYKAQSHDMMEKALELLENPDAHDINLDYDPGELDEVGSRILARNQYIRHIESQLLFIKIIAEQKEVMKPGTKLSKDSSQ